MREEAIRFAEIRIGQGDLQVIRARQLLQSLQRHAQQRTVARARCTFLIANKAFHPSRRVARGMRVRVVSGIVSRSGLMVGDGIVESVVTTDHRLLADAFFERQAVDDLLELGVDDGVVVGDAADEGDGVARSGQIAMARGPPKEEEDMSFSR